jgi:hypothetical protein
MRYCTIVLSALVGTVAWANQGSGTQASPRFAPTAGVIEPKADQELHRMSDYLSSLKSFRVDVATADERVTTDGQKVQQLKESQVSARRPNMMRVDRRGPAGHVVFRYDGKQYSLDAPDKKVYATAAAPPTIDAAIDDARDRLQIDAPGGDLMVRDPYAALTDGLITGRYLGLEPIGQQMAHHIAVTKKDVDYELWIADGDQPVPLRYVITTKDLPGHPEATVELSRWQPNAPISDDSVAFTPPPGSRRVAFAKPQQQGGNQ